MLDVATPLGGVLAVAQPVRLRPVEHQLDAVANAIRGLGLDSPDRLDDLEDHRLVDVGHVNDLDDRVGTRAQGVDPLLRVLGAPPTVSVLVEALCSAA